MILDIWEEAEGIQDMAEKAGKEISLHEALDIATKVRGLELKSEQILRLESIRQVLGWKGPEFKQNIMEYISGIDSGVKELSENVRLASGLGEAPEQRYH